MWDYKKRSKIYVNRVSKEKGGAEKVPYLKEKNAKKIWQKKQTYNSKKLHKSHTR